MSIFKRGTLTPTAPVTPAPKPTVTPLPAPVSRGSYKEKVDGFYLQHFDAVRDLGTGCNSTVGLYRGGEPLLTGRGWLERLKSEGITHVVDLRSEGGNQEKEAVEQAGLRYLRVKLKTEGVSQAAGAAEATLAAINQTLEALSFGARVYVHCQRGEDRTGTFIGLMRDCANGFKDYAAYGGSTYPALTSLRRDVEKLRGVK